MTVYVEQYGKAKLTYSVHRGQWLAEWKRDDVVGYGYGATIEEAIQALVEYKP